MINTFNVGSSASKNILLQSMMMKEYKGKLLGYNRDTGESNTRDGSCRENLRRSYSVGEGTEGKEGY